MDENKNKELVIPIEGEDGRKATCIELFKIEELNKMFIIYTYDEHDENGMEVIHVSEYVENDEDIELREVEPSDWEVIKDYLREIIKGEEA